MSGPRCACPATAADAYDCIYIRNQRAGKMAVSGPWPRDEYSDECCCSCHDDEPYEDEQDEDAA